MLQELMEQKAAMYGQQEDNQEGGQRSYDQQVASYQGQGQDQENEDQQQQYQQAMGRETPSLQQMSMQEGAIQDDTQQGANQVASYQQDNDQETNGEQTNQFQTSLQQGNSRDIDTQQGNAEGSYLINGGGQEQTYKNSEDSGESYQAGSDGVQQNDAGFHSSFDAGSIANILSESSNNPTANQDTQSLINEGQSITSSDAAQLAEAISNANKGLKGYRKQNSLSSAASNSASALSFTEGERGDSDGQNTSDNNEENGFQDSNRLMFPERQNFDAAALINGQSEAPSTQGMEQHFANPLDSSMVQDYHHDNNAESGLNQRNDAHGLNLDSSLAKQAAKYCTGCPRNAHCIDKVCIIDGDEPLAKILGALSGPSNETDDCRGCHHKAKCIKKECICKPGFNGNGTECRDTLISSRISFQLTVVFQAAANMVNASEVFVSVTIITTSMALNVLRIRYPAVSVQKRAKAVAPRPAPKDAVRRPQQIHPHKRQVHHPARR
ncbi:hypothetical protein QZH41_016908 [Actinostola sp. cb2023]|nr:hypothetical protein QZH41_016908 [Actinostola sp. cb2023]